MPVEAQLEFIIKYFKTCLNVGLTARKVLREKDKARWREGVGFPVERLVWVAVDAISVALKLDHKGLLEDFFYLFFDKWDSREALNHSGYMRVLRHTFSWKLEFLVRYDSRKSAGLKLAKHKSHISLGVNHGLLLF